MKHKPPSEICFKNAFKTRQRTVSSVTKRNCKMIFLKHFLCLLHVSPTDRPLPEASWEETGTPSSQMQATSPGLHVLHECRGTGLQCSRVMLCFGPCQAGIAGDPRRWAHWVSVAIRRLDVSLSASVRVANSGSCSWEVSSPCQQ